MCSSVIAVCYNNGALVFLSVQTSFDRSVLSSLVALRADFKTNKLAKIFT